MKESPVTHNGNKTERSCGAVLYKLIDGQPYYALVRGAVFGFPKGHMEGSETETQTAEREVREETGVSVKVDTGFRRDVTYHSPRFKNGMKDVTFFLAECPPDKTPAAGHEIKVLLMKPFDEAMKILKLDTLREVLKGADDYIRTKAALGKRQ